MNRDFLPNLKYIFVNPFFITRRYLYLNIKEFSKIFKSGTLLDIGCGTKPYESFFSVKEYIGMDYGKNGTNKNKNADVIYDGKNFPFPDDKFDYALATEVLEHVFDPILFLKEIHRVLKPHGYLLLTVPFVWDEHEQPFDYGRYTSFGLKYLLMNHGFEILEYKKTGNFITTLGQMTCTYFYYILSKNRYIYKISLLFIFAPIQILTLLVSKFLPENKGLYLDNIILVRKLK
jgi:SAM-dependent methyltransferase